MEKDKKNITNKYLNFTKQKREIEFSKLIIKWIMLTWFIGVIFAIGINIYQAIRYEYGYGISIAETLTYIAAPVTGGVIGYYIKTAIENPYKIGKKKHFEDMDLPVEEFNVENDPSINEINVIHLNDGEESEDKNE